MQTLACFWQIRKTVGSQAKRHYNVYTTCLGPNISLQSNIRFGFKKNIVIARFTTNVWQTPVEWIDSEFGR